MAGINREELRAEIEKAKADFATYAARATSKVEKAIQDAAIMVEADAKGSFKGRDAPSVYNEPPRVDTGRLRASITHRGGRDGDGEYFQEVGTNVEYASDVEFGTSTTMPHPFLTYAFEMHRFDIEKMIEEAMRDA